jgi:hypothetical protein
MYTSIFREEKYGDCLYITGLLCVPEDGVTETQPPVGEMGWVGLDWIGLAKDRNRWRALVNSVLNLRVP